jgi:hypothetical protein
LLPSDARPLGIDSAANVLSFRIYTLSAIAETIVFRPRQYKQEECQCRLG